MAELGPAVEELIVRARRGDGDALSTLLARQRPALEESARQTLATSGTAPEDISAAVTAAIAEAERDFGRFPGSSTAQLSAWLKQLVRGKLDASAAATLVTNKSPAAGGAAPPADASTLHRPNDAQTLVRPPGTRPDAETKADAATLKPAATANDATLPPPKKPGAPVGAASAGRMSTGGGPRGAAAPPQGQLFGDYELLSMIAKGGMGVVYKARQRKLNRVVAVKMILAGQFADELDVGRFYAEAEAAANLRHPNIVAIHEVGECQGQHFFSMDFIDGKSLADMVRESPLAPAEAARFGKRIAETMQFAHERGILHRDLKPSNVLVDKTREPLITDFGLAKRLGDQSQLTMSGTVVGTPSYMPPEQAAGKLDEVGPESDVYSLGAVLYELLTGAPPFRAATPFETVRQVLEREPVSPRLLNPAVPRDLETISLKCMQKERARRYRTAQELADELGRFLEGQPILARPIGPLARTWRWCRRNPGIASLGAATILGFVLALVATTVGFVLTSNALSVAKVAQQRSEESFRQAKQVVDELFTRVSEDTLLNQPGMQPLRKELLQKALDYYEEFLVQRADDPTLRDELALTYYRVGLITEQIESSEKAVAALERAREMQANLLMESPLGAADPATEPAGASPGPLAGSRASRLDSLGNTLNAIGRARQRMKEYDFALAAYRAAVDVREELAASRPDDGEFSRTLANSYMNIGLLERELGNAEAAHEQFEKAQAIRLKHLVREPGHVKTRRDLGMGYYNLANLAIALGDDADAEKNLADAVAAFEKLLVDDPKDLANKYRLSICYRRLGDLKSIQGDLTAAVEHYETSLGWMEPLALMNPDVAEYQQSLAGLHMNVGELERERKRNDEARAAFLRAVGFLKPLAEKYPEMPLYRRDFAVTLRALAEVQVEAGEIAQAKANLRTSLEHLNALADEFPDDADIDRQRDETRAALEKLSAPIPALNESHD